MLDHDPAAPTPLTALPLDAWHRAEGGRMVDFAGHAMPIQYEGIVAEHEWTRTQAGLFDVSHMGQLLLSGEGLDDALEALLPGDVRSLALGRLRYSLLLDENGGVLDDLIFARWPGGIYMVVNGATKYDDIAWLREHLPDAITLNHLDDRALLALQGPKAFDVLQRHTTGQWDLGVLSFMQGGLFAIGGVEAWISRSGYTGEDGFEISIDRAHAEEVATLLRAEPEVKPIGLGARDSLRLEAGLPLYGHDLSPATDPVAADLVFAVAPKRRRGEGVPFMGAKTVRRVLAEGPQRRRVGLRLDGRQPAREGATVHAGDADVGVVTSGGFAPTLGAPIAMAYVGTDWAEAGTRLEVDVRGRRLPATVTPMPFVPHRYHRQPKAGAA